MARQVLSQVVEVRSVAAAAGVDAAPFRSSGELVTVHVLDAPANLVRVMGSVDGGVFALMTWEGAAGVAAINAVGVGVYEVRERPMFIRIGVNQDVNAARSFRVQLFVHVHT